MCFWTNAKSQENSRTKILYMEYLLWAFPYHSRGLRSSGENNYIICYLSSEGFGEFLDVLFLPLQELGLIFCLPFYGGFKVIRNTKKYGKTIIFLKNCIFTKCVHLTYILSFAGWLFNPSGNLWTFLWFVTSFWHLATL